MSHMNSLDENLQGIVNKFVGYTKIGGNVDSAVSYQKLQWDFDRLGEWAKEWQIMFNSVKYEVLKSNQQ